MFICSLLCVVASSLSSVTDLCLQSAERCECLGILFPCQLQAVVLFVGCKKEDWTWRGVQAKDLHSAFFFHSVLHNHKPHSTYALQYVYRLCLLLQLQLKVEVPAEPTLLALGPFHLATAAGHQVTYYEVGEKGLPLTITFH